MSGEPTILIPTPSGWIAITHETLRNGLYEASEIIKDIRQPTEIDKAGFSPTSLMRPIGGTTHTDNANLIDAREAGRLFGVKPSWLLQRAREQRMPHYRIGKYIRFDPAEVRAETHQNPDRHAN